VPVAIRIGRRQNADMNFLRSVWNKYRLAFLALAAAGPSALALCDWTVGRAADGRVFQTVEAVPNYDVALILGTSKYVHGGRTNLFYTPRIEAAAALYRQGKVRGLLVSGDNSRASYDEPTQMKEDLIALGVPAAHITCDFAGFSTLDSVIRAGKVFQQTSFLVVSQAFHVERAIFLAQAQGYQVDGLAVRSPSGYWSTKVRLREVLARAKAMMDTKVFRTRPHFLGPVEAVGLRTG